MEGRRLGRYRISSKLAEGGMGAVYLATHELMGREVVIKVLLPQMSTQRDIVQRFFNEARATGSLNHPGIVAIFDLDYADDGRAYIVMERLQGETLQQRLRRVQRMSVGQTVDVTRQLASALGAAHGKGVVHRDLKPGNIFLGEDPEVPGRERVKVLDFGVAKLALQQSSLVTRAGAVVGTPGYMAPEQCRDSSMVDHRADLYALGCIMYACLCSRPPFVGDTVEVLAAQLRDTPMPPRALDPSLPPWLDEMITRLLEKDPGRRLQSCAQVIEVLDHGARQGWQSVPAGRGSGAGVAMAPVPPRAPQVPAAHRPAGRDVPAQPTATQGPGSTTFSKANAVAEVHYSSSGARRRMWLGIGGSALVVLGFGLYLALASSGQESARLQAPETEPELRPGPGPAANGTSAAGDEGPGAEDPDGLEGSEQGPAEPTPPASADTGGDVQALLDEARAALASKDWAVAGSKAQEVLQHVPEHAAAREIVTTAEQEQANAMQYREFEQALKIRDFDKAESRLAALPAGSVYRESGKAKLARARDGHQADLQRAMAQAETWRDAGKCDDIRALQAAWAEIESEIEAMVVQCEQARKKPAPSAGDGKVAAVSAPAAAAPAVAAPASAGSERKPAASGSTERKPTPSRSQFDELLAQSQEAVKQGSHAKAQRLCRQALAIQPKEPRAVDVCAVSACNLRNAAQARGYYAMASAERQSKIYRFCLSKGIDLAR